VLWKFDFFQLFCTRIIECDIFLAARCSPKPILKVEFNSKDDTSSNYLLDRPTLNLKKKVGLQRIIFNSFQLTTTEAMSSYEDEFFKIGVIFHALYFENKVGVPPIFLHFRQR